MNITVYTSFSKRKNSTKQPTGGTLVSNVELKKSTSIHSPTFILGAITGVTMESITYVKAFGNYYYVGDISVTPHGYYEIACNEDPMASNKTAILASTQYVLYSASSYNFMIPDGRIVPNENEVHITGHDCNDLELTDQGTFILSCLNSEHGDYFVTYYAMDATNVHVLAEYMDSDIWAGQGTLEQWFENVVGHGYDAIISLKWVPIKYTEVPGTAVTVWLGNHEASWTMVTPPITNYVYGKIVPDTDPTLIFTGNIYPTWHYLNDWRLEKPYTRGKLYLPAYGFIEINPVEFRTNCVIRYCIDMISGECTIYIYGNSNKLVTTVSFQIAVDIPIAQLASKGIAPILAGVGAVAGIAGGIATGGIAGVAAAAAGAAGLSKATTDLFYSTPSYRGTQGGKSWIGMKHPYISELYVETQDLNEFITTQGRPLMEEVQLSTLSGFCQCANASVDLNCMESDRDYVNGCLNSGFYIE